MSSVEKSDKGNKNDLPIPDFVKRRLDLFNSFTDRTPRAQEQEIEIELCEINTESFRDAHGEKIKIIAGKTTPADISKQKYPNTLVLAAAFKKEKNLLDLSAPINEPGKMCFLTFDDDRGREVFWHSSSHILGASLELMYGVEIAIGPATEQGFFYDFEPKEGLTIDPKSLEQIEKVCINTCKSGSDFERKMVTHAEALSVFTSNHYKTQILKERCDPADLVTLYRAGTFIDLCRGPHVLNAKPLSSWWIVDTSASVWNKKQDHQMTRVRAITFPSGDMLKKHKNFIRDAQQFDHRRLGTDLGLFFIHEWSPGCPFFYPEGAYMLRRFVDLIRAQYKKRHFIEVGTPNIFYDDLFKRSGHWDHYRDNMFHFPVDDDGDRVDEHGHVCAAREMGLKPMNCPGHCLVFKSKSRSYRELPIRMAEFGVLHRNEASGALTGLTRVRRFVQDDAHIFLQKEKIGDEINDAIDFMNEIYGIMNMELEFTLSVRSADCKYDEDDENAKANGGANDDDVDKYAGNKQDWDFAESVLEKILTERLGKVKIVQGEAAFYGPKIDVLVRDILDRRHQLATIQLDFQLPKRFDLEFMNDKAQPVRPVMIHRAVLGSLERFLAIAIEHFRGKFPFWMSPRQIVVFALDIDNEEQNNRVKQIYEQLNGEGFSVSIDGSSYHLKKKILNAFKVSANCVCVIGANEIKNNTITVNWRGYSSPKEYKYQEFVEEIRCLYNNWKDKEPEKK